MARQGFGCQCAQRVVNQRGRAGQGMGQRVERGLAARQRFGIAHEFKAIVHGVAQHVGQVVQVEGGQVLGAVLQPQRAEGPTQRVAAVFVHVDVQRAETRAFGQEVAAHDAVGQRGIAPLQECDRWPDGGQVARLHRHERLDGGRVLVKRQRVDPIRHGAQALRRQQAQHQRKRQVFLHRVHVARTQETGQVGGGGVGRIQLRHRRDDGQHA
ncbi:hypothetical protein D3C87_1345830 [compost metagenome]